MTCNILPENSFFFPHFLRNYANEEVTTVVSRRLRDSVSFGLVFSMRQPLLFFLGLFLAVGACTTPEEVPDPSRLSYDFYPLAVGQYSIYDIYQIRYQSSARDTQHYQIKEQVMDTLNDLTNEPAFLIHRFSRSNPTRSWRLDSAWLTKRTAYLAIRKENNVDFAKLSFPLKEGIQWNGNQFNNFGSELYRATELDQPYQVLDSLYPQTVTVTQRDEANIISKDRRLEVYARNTGLIYKERIQYEYVQESGSVGKPGEVQYGIYYILKIREFGVEK